MIQKNFLNQLQTQSAKQVGNLLKNLKLYLQQMRMTLKVSLDLVLLQLTRKTYSISKKKLSKKYRTRKIEPKKIVLSNNIKSEIKSQFLLNLDHKTKI